MAKRKKTRKKSTRKKTTSRKSVKRKPKRVVKKKASKKSKTTKRKSVKNTAKKSSISTTKSRKPARKAKTKRTVVIARQGARPHDGLVAFLLEFVVGALGILGIGHIYNGKYSKGLFFMVGMWLYLLISLLILIVTKGSPINITLVPIILIIGLIIILSSAINAMKEARE